MPQNKPHIRSEAVQDILTRVPSWMIRWGNTVVLVLLVLFFVLCWFIKYPDVIPTEATVTSLTPPQKEYAQVSGRIDTILVEDASIVKPGEILATIENSAVLEDVLYLKNILDTLTITKGHLHFPVEDIPVLSLGDINTAYALFETDYINYKLNTTLSPYTNSLGATQMSAAEIQLRIKNLDGQKSLDKKALEYSRIDLQRHKDLYEKGVISRQEYEQKEFNYLKEERNFQNLDISISQLKQSLGDAYSSAREIQINNKMESTRLYKNAIQSLNNLKEALKKWQLQYALTSNIDGEVSFMGIWNNNQTVNSGDLVFSIIPANERNFIAKVKAPIQNSGKIKIGQSVNIKLFNYPETEYGMLQGTVASMSAIPDSEGFYLLDVALSEKLITSYDIEIPFKTEMSGTAEIITEDLNLLERLFYQLRDIFN